MNLSAKSGPPPFLIRIFQQLTSSDDTNRQDGLRYWQERVVYTLLLTGVILGLVTYIPSVRMCINEGLWAVAVFDTALYAMICVLFFVRRIPYTVRAAAILTAVFLLGILLLILVGPSTSGPVWLFAFPVLAGLLIGTRTSIVSLLINLMVLLIAGLFIYQESLMWMSPQPLTMDRWIVTAVNFFLLNSIAVLAITVLLKGLQSSLDHEKALRRTLEHEIEERREAEFSLRESEERYRAIIQGAAEGIVIFDAEQLKIDFVNPVVCAMLGYVDNELLGRPISSVFNDSENDQSLPDWRSVDFQETVRINDYHLSGREGQALYVNFSTTRITVANRDCVAVFMTDITAKKSEELEKQKLKEHLQQAQKMEAIGTLAGGIAHDFNNILSSVLGYTELAIDEAAQGSDMAEFLQEVHTAGKRAKGLVKQILTFARQTNEEFKPVQVNLIAKEALKLLRASIPTSVEIRQQLDCDALVMADPTQIHQAFMNLCTNAAQAMEEDGGVLEVGLSAATVTQPINGPGSDIQPGQYLKITITDTGCGIPRKHLETIFDPYFTTKAIGEGTGLGLAVVEGIVKHCGGEIQVESWISRGTVFTIYLPATQTNPKAKSYTPQPLPTGSEKVLVVDDEEPIASMISRRLDTLGYHVQTATDSNQAFALFSADPDRFDLVITDMNMPRMTGDKLARKLLQIRTDLPIILCTGFSKQLSEERAADIGIRALLKKPVSMDDMARSVRRALDDDTGSIAMQK